MLTFFGGSDNVILARCPLFRTRLTTARDRNRRFRCTACTGFFEFCLVDCFLFLLVLCNLGNRPKIWSCHTGNHIVTQMVHPTLAHDNCLAIERWCIAVSVLSYCSSLKPRKYGYPLFVRPHPHPPAKPARGKCFSWCLLLSRFRMLGHQIVNCLNDHYSTQVCLIGFARGCNCASPVQKKIDKQGGPPPQKKLSSGPSRHSQESLNPLGPKWQTISKRLACGVEVEGSNLTFKLAIVLPPCMGASPGQHVAIIA